MGNCLVTKLKGVVDNDNLDKLGMLRGVMDPIETPGVGNRIVIQGSGITATIVGDGKFTNSGATYDESGDIGKTVQSPFEGWSSMGNYTIEISNKYNLRGNINTGYLAINLDKLDYSGPFISIGGHRLSGNIVDTMNKSSSVITRVIIDDCPDIYGNIGELNAFGISELILQETNVNGCLEVYLEKIYNILKDDGTDSRLFKLNNKITFLTRTQVKGYVLVASKTGSTLYCKNTSGSRTMATYDGTNWRNENGEIYTPY